MAKHITFLILLFILTLTACTNTGSFDGQTSSTTEHPISIPITSDDGYEAGGEPIELVEEEGYIELSEKFGFPALTRNEKEIRLTRSLISSHQVPDAYKKDFYFTDEDRVQALENMLFYMPYLALALEQAVEFWPNLKDPLLDIAKEAKAITDPAQELVDIGAPASAWEAMRRVDEFISYVFSSYPFMVSLHFDVAANPVETVHYLDPNDPFVQAAPHRKLIETILKTAKMTGLSDISRNLEDICSLLFPDKTLPELVGYAEPKLTVTTDKQKGLRFVTVDGLAPDTILVYDIPANYASDPEPKQLVNGDVFYIPLSFAGELHFYVFPAASYVDRYEINKDVLTVTLSVKAEEALLDTPVTFQNSTLEGAVRKYINKPEGVITKKDLLPITGILIDGNNYRINPDTNMEIPVRSMLVETAVDMSDFAQFDNLTYLAISNTTLSSLDGIEPYAQNLLANTLYLANNQVADISPLSKTHVGFLNLADNQIQDISPLVGRGMTVLNLADNPLPEDGILFAKIRTSSLILDNTPVSTLALHPQTLWSYRYTLSLSNTKITSLAFLDCKTAPIYDPSGTFHIYQLNLDNIPLTSEDLSLLRGVYRLSLRNCGLTDLDFIKYWGTQRECIRQLDIRDNGLVLGETEGELLRRCSTLYEIYDKLYYDRGNTVTPEFLAVWVRPERENQTVPIP